MLVAKLARPASRWRLAAIAIRQTHGARGS
jgi:hypothetical protein